MPKVYLYNQGIKKFKEDKVEHIYTSSFKDINHEYVQICLYHPKYREWDNTMLISETIIPWAIEWLYYYEYWRITGKWLGDEIMHEQI